MRYRGNDYSVPTRYGFRDVLVKGFVDHVAILCDGETIARHPRSYGARDFVFDPLHYLALLETKPNALDQAAPLQDWNLPGLSGEGNVDFLPSFRRSPTARRQATLTKDSAGARN